MRLLLSLLITFSFSQSLLASLAGLPDKLSFNTQVQIINAFLSSEEAQELAFDRLSYSKTLSNELSKSLSGTSTPNTSIRLVCTEEGKASLSCRLDFFDRGEKSYVGIEGTVVLESLSSKLIIKNIKTLIAG